MDVEDIKRAMEHVIVSDEDEEVDRARKEAALKLDKVLEVKGLDELLEDVQAEADDEAKSGSALVAGTS